MLSRCFAQPAVLVQRPGPRDGWIAAAAAAGWLSARALAPEGCGQGMTLRRRGLVSRSSRLWLAVTDGDARCKYIGLAVLVVVCNAWRARVKVADGLLFAGRLRVVSRAEQTQQSRAGQGRAGQGKAGQGLLSERTNEGKQQKKQPAVEGARDCETARLRWWREAPVLSPSLARSA